MKETKISEGVVAEYNGKYWGKQKWNYMAFGLIENAIIEDPKQCKVPTYMTTKDQESSYTALSKARLVKVKKTVTIEVMD